MWGERVWYVLSPGEGGVMCEEGGCGMTFTW